jgi:aryl-alcohol dehydrogenase-like predicted oxidoreductase
MTATRNYFLGGAQFGNGYGKHISTPELSIFELNNLLEYATSSGIQHIDLAQNYDSAVNNLSRTDYASEFTYTTKIQYEPDAEQKILADLHLELKMLGIVSYHSVLLHNWATLSAVHRIAAVQFVKSLKKDGICFYVGVSVYDIWELEFEDWIPDTVQAPLNFYNREFPTNDIAINLKTLGTNFVARSIFHQGLLLNSQLKDKFPDLEDFIDFCNVNDFSYTHGALSVYDSQDLFHAIVIGVASTSQLEEILNTKISRPNDVVFPKPRVYSPDFTDPRKW